jgi:hypothetical protein
MWWLGVVTRVVVLDVLLGWGGSAAIPVKVGIFRNFGGFAEIEACRGRYHRRGESQERAR